MELDDLKKDWNAQQPSTQGNDRELIRSIIHRSHRGLTRLLRWELAIGLVTLIFVVAMIAFFRGRMTGFYIKLTLPLVAYAIPIYYRLHRSARFLQNVDYSEEVRSTLSQFLRYYTRTLHFYQWGGYAAILVATLLIFTDAKFLETSWTVKGLVLGYMAFVMILIGPLVKRLYGVKAKRIREYLDENG